MTRCTKGIHKPETVKCQHVSSVTKSGRGEADGPNYSTAVRAIMMQYTLLRTNSGQTLLTGPAQ